jgi:hypothetical protein
MKEKGTNEQFLGYESINREKGRKRDENDNCGVEIMI